MAIQTDITKLLGIKYPIIQGGLQGLGREPLVSAVSEAGCLGLITAGTYPSKKEMIDDIELVRKKTNKPFGVNLSIGIRKPMDEYVEGVIESGVNIVFTSGNSPAKFMDPLKKAGVKVVHVVPSVRFARKAEELGCDAVVIVGYECGGHPGADEVTSMVKIPQVVESVNIPVIAAGGFNDGRGLIAALSLGAQGIQMGTRFVMSQESPLPEKIKETLTNANITDTLVIKRSINKPNRVYKNKAALKVLELEDQNAKIEELLPIIGGEAYKVLIDEGDINAGVLSIGQVIGRINQYPSVQEIIDGIIIEAESVIKKMNQFWQPVGH
ncbi:nitronate monooxygenase family protein [Cytobacillus firmus]|uniref:NAD(P)H-dependent flavin oxidoreductase n=1 Tax=Cytobacillus firmus TaxID=1399 RepID=UPI0021624F4C|nr:nitronate monooxygenase [Cytobacillus firmus]MCS0671261.1 nitronate monooxygenase [Cytobacillus firmus]